MKKLLRRLLKFFAYTAGSIVILLAILVGLFRLFLPRLPEYQEDIKSWASAAIGMDVEFSGMDARWGLSGPEIEFYDAELISRETRSRIVAADEVSIGLGLSRLLFDRKAVVDRVVVRDTTLEVRQLPNGQWWVQGSPPDKLLPLRNGSTNGDASGGLGPIEIVGEDIEVQFLQPGDERPRLFRIPSFHVRRDDVRLAVHADVDLPDDLGGNLTVTATQMLSGPPAERIWDVTFEINDVDVAGVTAMQPLQAAQFDSGQGDIELSLAIADGRVISAAADVDLDELSIAGLSDLSLSGSFEFLSEPEGWLIAANDFQASTPAGEWPKTTLRFETSTDGDGKIVMIDARATYLNFADAAVAIPWLNDQQRTLLSEFDPSGVVRDLNIRLSDLGTESPRFNVSATMDDVGIGAYGKRPGFRGFSGSVRADQSSGLLEIDSDSLVVTVPNILGRPLAFDTTSGTVIWRRSNDRTTVLSDSIVLRNEFLDTESSIELSLADGGGKPFIDLESRFSVSDLSIARRYVPFMPKRPRMSQWFQEGLQSGRIERGSARLFGQMDNWPFDDGDGQLLIRGTVRDAILVYQPNWPEAEVIEADIAIENMSLFSARSHVVTAGNLIRNARLEIADFRNPHRTQDEPVVSGGTSVRAY